MTGNTGPRLALWNGSWTYPTDGVTDPRLGLTSAEQFTTLGNGVVPAQAAHALRALLAIV